MKKMILSLMSVILLCSGCDVYTTKVIKPGVDIYTYYKDVFPDEWSQSGKAGELGCYYYADFTFKEIDNRVMKDGAVTVYLIDEEDNDNPLPYLFPVWNGRKTLMQNIRYSVSKGVLTIKIEWEDNDIYELRDKMNFKVCILSPGD